MVKIILATHGEFSKAILESAEMIMGPQENITAISFYANESPKNLMEKIEKELDVSREDEILILTDLKGGTPCNTSLLLSRKYKLTVLTGLNLPVLLEAIISKDIEEFAEGLGDKLVEAGSTSIEKISLVKGVK